ncbi:DnaJ-domain-containing protein [Ramaria rubella]|nr:DnaJ-domain-containing protein [Ramaria rubella]
MAGKDEDLNAYELLGVTIEATEQEIKSAYRQRSLKVHPDRHPNNPDAATKFHELNQAYELLLDPIRKTTLDASLRVKVARKERFAKFDSKRKGMQDELEDAERAVKRAKMDKEREERNRKEEAEKIKEEGRKMRQDRQDAMTRKEEEKKTRERESTEALKLGEYLLSFAIPSLWRPISGPLDTTVRIKYPLSKYPTLTTPSSLDTLLSSFGSIDVSSIVISMKPSKKAPNKPPKFATALASFGKIGDAHAAVCASGMEARGMKDIDVSWAEGKEPSVLEALKWNHQLDLGGHNLPSSNPAMHQPHMSARTPAGPGVVPASSAPSFSFDPSESQHPPSPAAVNVPGLDYESITLMRLRQAERERLEREIREQETVL